jgi:hypothetical protein
LREKNCEIGLHGSYFSLEENLLERERQNLEQTFNRPVLMGRQHWLNLPGEASVERIFNAGITVDSTLGWNGSSGFRGGMARPFPILLSGGKHLWEVPLVLMDGPLFNDLGLDTDGVFAYAKKILQQVWVRRGMVAINWHERAAHPDYGWFEAYRRILEWAKGAGFQFAPISQATKPWTNRGN